MTTELGCSGNWEVEVARSAYLEQTAKEAKKRAAERENAVEEDTSRLDALIALAEADLKRRAEAEEDDFVSQLVDEVEADYFRKKAEEARAAKTCRTHQVVVDLLA
jgi:hypothetical protein